MTNEDRAPLTAFYCACGAALSAPKGTGAVTCHACGAKVGVPVLSPAAPAPRSPSGRRPFTVAMRIFIGGGLLIGAKLGHRAAEEAYTHGDKVLLYALMVAVPLGIAFILGGLYELVSNNRIGFFGRE